MCPPNEYADSSQKVNELFDKLSDQTLKNFLNNNQSLKTNFLEKIKNFTSDTAIRISELFGKNYVKDKSSNKYFTNYLNILEIFTPLLTEIHENYALIVQNDKANGGSFNAKEFWRKMENLVSSIVQECAVIREVDKIKETSAYKIVIELRDGSQNISKKCTKEDLCVIQDPETSFKRHRKFTQFSQSKVLANLRETTQAIKNKSVDTSPVFISALKLLGCFTVCVLGATAGFLVGGVIGAVVGGVAAGAVTWGLCYGYDKYATKSVTQASKGYLAEVERSAKCTLS